MPLGDMALYYRVAPKLLIPSTFITTTNAGRPKMIMYPGDCLSGRFVRRSPGTVLTSIATADRESTHARGQKRKGVIFGLPRIEIIVVVAVVRWTCRDGAVAGGLEGSLSSSAVEWPGRV